MVPLPEDQIIANFTRELATLNFSQCRTFIDKNNKEGGNSKLLQLLSQILQFDRNYFSLEFVSNRKQFNKFQDTVKDFSSLDGSIIGGMATVRAIESLKPFFRTRSDSALLYDNLFQFRVSDTQIGHEDHWRRVSDNLEAMRDFSYEPSVSPLITFLNTELNLLSSIRNTTLNLAQWKHLEALRHLKRSENLLRDLKDSRFGNEESQGRFPWGSSKPKLTLFSYLTNIVSFLGAQFALYFYETLSKFEGDKAFTNKNSLYTALVNFSKTHRTINCVLVFDTFKTPLGKGAGQGFRILDTQNSPEEEERFQVVLALDNETRREHCNFINSVPSTPAGRVCSNVMGENTPVLYARYDVTFILMTSLEGPRARNAGGKTDGAVRNAFTAFCNRIRGVDAFTNSNT